MRISDWSSDVCSSDLRAHLQHEDGQAQKCGEPHRAAEASYLPFMRFRFASRHISVADALRFITCATDSSLQIGNRNGSRKGAHQRLFGSKVDRGLEDAGHALQRFFDAADTRGAAHALRSEEHTSELQSLMRTSYAVF